MKTDIQFRSMTRTDASTVAFLAGQLGYSATEDELKKRFSVIDGLLNQACFVADQGGVVMGWVQVFGVHLLASPRPFAEIGGLVVDEKARRQGVGSALVTRAEQWAHENDYAEVRLRSGLHRPEAHLFYVQNGYVLTKTSYMFRKVL